MITQSQIREWISDALLIFEIYMPVNELSRPLPQIYIGSPKTITSLRAALVKQTGSLQTKASGTAIMEMIHGGNGDAILIQQKLILDPERFKDARRDFIHQLWHELGHFFAINAETTNLFRYFNEDWTCTNSPDRSKQEGYWMWAEFVAEAISFHVESELHNDASHPYMAAIYPDKEITEWRPRYWHPSSDKLQHLLDLTMHYYTYTLDEAALGTYFATLLMDQTTVKYIQAMAEGKLLEEDFTADTPWNTYRNISPDEFDAEHIEELDPVFHEDLRELKHLLAKQIEKKGFWVVEEDFMDEIGKRILSLMQKKQMLLNERSGSTDGVLNPFANLR